MALPRFGWLAGLALALLLQGLAAPAARADTPQYEYAEKRFRIEVSVPADGGSLRAAITPRTPWKLSADFPIRLAVEGGPTTRRPVPGSPDGALLELPTWELPSGPIRGRISVAVCQGELCERADHDFRIETP